MTATIQWFPGHMAKAIRHIKETSSTIDVIMEVLDARAPKSSQNPVLEEILQKKPRLIILNKADLCDSRALRAWIAYFKTLSTIVLPVNAISGKGSKKIESALVEVFARKNTSRKLIRVTVFGVPNVGKSSLINHLIGKKKTLVGNKPGVTKKQIWHALGEKCLLLDTPGILWPKFESPDIGQKLAALNCIKEQRYDSEEIAYYLCDFLMAHYPRLINQRFKLDEEFTEATNVFEAIGKKHGYFLSGNEIDITRVYNTFIREFRSGKIGRISLEKPPA
ncbi:MAG: ribosome biogenesis GTPase YlqF [Candidatus Margulisbacteria bacterium]|nr:ribosome biogenesis GTPase YlqF [Candidatus Margulisiibacteriota bacterium]